MEGEQAPTGGQQQMKIFLRVIKTVPLTVNSSDTIEHIKTKFCDLEGIPVDQQEMFFSGNHLKDTRALADYSVPNNSTINLYTGDGMRLFIQVPVTGKIFQLNVKKYDTIMAVKAKIQIKEGIPSKRQTLIYLGRTLCDTDTMNTHNIRDGANFSMVLRPVDEMQISVRMVCGRTITLEVTNWFAIVDIKVMIENLEGIPLDRQILIHDGKRLEDHLTLLDNKICNDSVLWLELFLQLFIKGCNGKTVTVMVCRNDTVAMVVSNIENKMGFSMRKQMLCYNGRILREDKILSDYCIQHGSTIHLRARTSCEVKHQIFVEMEHKETLSLNVPLNSTIEDVKGVIQEKTKIPVGELKLKFLGEDLPDKSNLQDNKVQRGSILRVKGIYYR